MELPELYRGVTEQIVAHLKEGHIPWAKPWDNKACVPALPENAVTQRRYNGMNILMLWSEATLKGYPSHRWMTFQQAREVGANVRKGEKSTTAVFTKFVDVEVEKDGKTETEQRPMLRTYSVFNVAQIDNLPAVYTSAPLITPEMAYDGFLKFVEATHIKVVYGGSKACYMPNRDEVHMPPYGSFLSDELFCGVLAHEMTHATAAPHRLDRRLSTRFGNEAYAREELIAELGSAFICADHGVTPTTRSNAAYIESWIKVLENDHKAIFHAASQASQAAKFLNEQAEHAIHPDTPEVERVGEREIA